MSSSLLVWKWSGDFDTPAKRKKHRLRFADVVASFAQGGHHPAMAAHDFVEFDRRLVEALGPEVVDGPYILERHPCARVANLPASRAAALVPVVGGLAQSCGLNAAEM